MEPGAKLAKFKKKKRKWTESAIVSDMWPSMAHSSSYGGGGVEDPISQRLHLGRISSWLLVASILLRYGGQAQLNVKGGGAGGVSSFRENILSVQRQQQQQLVPIQQQQAVVSEVQQVTSQRQIQSSFTQQQQQQQSIVDAEPAIYGSVKGDPGVDFPAYTSIPNTKFSCQGVPYDPGMYADESLGCQVYHLCYQGRRESFLCGIGTVFNQAIMSCDFWHSVECGKSSQYYNLNSEFGKASAETSGGGASASLQQQRLQLNQVFRPQNSNFATKSFVSSNSNFVRQQQLVVPPPPQVSNTFVRVEESSFSQSGGKVSPPKIQQQSFQRASSDFSSGGKTSARSLDHMSFSSQRTSSSGLLSPGRRAAALNGGQFASESSPMQTIAAENTKQQQADLLQVTSGKTSARRVQTSESKFSGDSSNFIETSGQQQQQSFSSADDQIWKPVFKSKTSGSKTAAPSRGNNEQQQPMIKVTPSGESPVSSTEAPSTPAPPAADQEPAFSSNNSSPPPQAESESPEQPSVPKSEPPPPPPQTTTTPEVETTSGPQTTTSESSESSPISIESDVGPAMSSTAQPPSSEPEVTNEPTSSTTSAINETSETPQTTTSAPDTTTTAAAAEASSEAPAPTTTPAAETTTEAMMTTTQAATSETDGTEESPAPSSATSDEQPTGEQEKVAKKRRKKKKKRRGAAGEATLSSQKASTTTLKPKARVAASEVNQQQRINGSSVEYAGYN